MLDGTIFYIILGLRVYKKMGGAELNYSFKNFVKKYFFVTVACAWPRPRRVMLDFLIFAFTAIAGLVIVLVIYYLSSSAGTKVSGTLSLVFVDGNKNTYIYI